MILWLLLWCGLTTGTIAQISKTEQILSHDTTYRRGSTDTIVVATAKDSMHFTPQSKTLNLYGNATMQHKQQYLKAATITIDFANKTLKAFASHDSTGKMYGFPILSDAGRHYAGEQMHYNFITGKGTVSVGETNMESGFYFGSKIHKADTSTFYVRQGCFTTCDAPHPHFYFCSTRMKIIPGDRVMLDNIILMVEDVPVMYLPLGMVFPNRGGRQSGFLTPRPAFSAQRGVMLSNLGYYWAASDYMGVLLSTTYYSKGGYELNATIDYALRYILTGKAFLSYANVRLDPLSPYSQQYRIFLNHQHTLSPTTHLGANLEFLSQGYINATQFALSERIRSNIISSAGLQHTFESGIGISANFIRNQDIVTLSYTNTTTFSLTVPSTMPLREVLPSSNWLSSLTISYNGTANGTIVRDIGQIPHPFDSLRWSGSLRHSPQVTISPRFGFFSVTPRLDIQAATYLRRITRIWDITTRRPVDRVEYGLFNEASVSIGLNVRTSLYGTPLFLARTFAIRHTLIPNIGLSITPDLSSPRYGFYGLYSVPPDSLIPSQQIQYSRYLLDGGGIAPRQRVAALTYTFDNSIDGKWFDDTVSRKIEIFRFSISGLYNFAADSLRLSDQTWSFRLPTIANLSLTATMTTTTYDEAPVRNLRDSIIGYQRIDRFRAERLGLANALRPTSFSISFSTSFNQHGIVPPAPPTPNQQPDTTAEQIGQRFRQRMEYEQQEPDLWGQRSPGYTPLSIPWSVTLNASYRYNRPYAALPAVQEFNVSASVDLTLTRTWDVGIAGSYDLFSGILNGINLRISKQIHCWSFSLVCYPVGINRGFYLVINPLARILSDLKIEKRSTPIFR